MEGPEAKCGSVQHVESGSEQHVESSSCEGETQMNWSWSRKHIILLQCCLQALCPGFTSTILIPGVQGIAEDFNTPLQTATYIVAVHVLFLGLGPFFWNPLINSYGRRPILIASAVVSCVAALGGGFAESYGGLMASRVFQSIASSTGFVVPGIIVVDIFNAQERGRKNGFWTQMVAVGAPLGALIGGPIVYYLGWRWALWIVAIANGVQAVGFTFFYPETSNIHRQHSGLGAYSFAELWSLPRRITGHLGLRSFIEPLLFFQSPNVTLIALAYGVSFAIILPGIATIVPVVLEEFYDFGPIAQGSFFAGPLVGALLAEVFGGRLGDWAMNRERRRAAQANRRERLECRLWVGLLGFIMGPLGVVIFGVTLQTHRHWIAPCLGFSIANFGLQLITTPFKTYCVDCYSTKPGSVLQFINVIRQTISFTLPFWSPNLGEAVGYGLGFGIQAIIIVVFCALSVLVLWKGAAWRQSIKVSGLR